MVRSTPLGECITANQPRKPQHGRRGSVLPKSRRADMHPWIGPEPSPSSGSTQDPENDASTVSDDLERTQESFRQMAVGGPGAGDIGGVQLPQRARFTRSSSSLQQVPEETALSLQESALPIPATCSIRRARRLTEYRHGHQHQICRYDQPPPQELPAGSSVMNSLSGTSLGPPITFNPPGVEWQRLHAAELHLTVVLPLSTLSPGPGTTFAPNVPPRRCRPVAGDGNCLFRALSWWITGSEDEHMEVRQSIVDELRRDGGRQYDSIAQPYYVDESRIDSEGVWGSDVEIFVAATMLRTPVAVYSAFGDHQYLWQVFHPLERTEGAAAAAAGPDTNDAGHLIYLQNSNSHFEPVIDI